MAEPALRDPMVVDCAPLLSNGDVMSREEFHRRYAECEDLERAELIEGVVYLPSPVKIELHERPRGLMVRWLEAYAELHPGEVEAMGGGSLILDDENELQPDAMLYRLREGRFSEDGYLAGGPELAVEISNSTVSKDLHQKKRAYERNGVRDYIVWRVQDEAIDWFGLRDGRYERRERGPDGIIESAQFPGLRLDAAAALRHDRKALLAAISA